MLCRARSTAASSWTRARRPKRRAGRCGRSALWPQRASSLAPLRSLSARGRPHRRSLLSRCGDPSHLIPSSDDLQCHQSSGLATSRRTRRAQPRARAARRTLTRVAVVESSWACQTLSASSDVIMGQRFRLAGHRKERRAPGWVRQSCSWPGAAVYRIVYRRRPALRPHRKVLSRSMRYVVQLYAGIATFCQKRGRVRFRISAEMREPDSVRACVRGRDLGAD